MDNFYKKENIKIIATIGPSCDDFETLKKMYDSGMNIARLNFSHGSYSYFEKVIKIIRKVSLNIGILLDTKGPEIRTFEIEKNLILESGDKVFISNKILEEEIILNNKFIGIDYLDVLKLTSKNDLYIDDGLIHIKIVKNEKDYLVGIVQNNSFLGSKKSVTIRNHKTNFKFLSKKDIDDINFGIKNQVDFLALSFVRSVKDINLVKKILQEKKSEISIISKIENQLAIDNIESIIKNSYGIMVARGDLGVELPLHLVPKYQKKIIDICKREFKPVIVATQMLESMKDNPLPTRAEVSDVANAILDGTDCIMLSGETAIGKYPIRAIKTMAKISKEYELIFNCKIKENKTLTDTFLKIKDKVQLSIINLSYISSHELPIKFFLVLSETGKTPKLLSKFKPHIPIVVFTTNYSVVRKLELSYAVFPIYISTFSKSYEVLFKKISKEIKERVDIKDTDLITSIYGSILGEVGHINKLEINEFKDFELK